MSNAKRKSKSLYEIESQFFDLEDIIDNEEGDITEIEKELEEYLKSCEKDLENKVSGYIYVMRNLESLAEQRENEAFNMKKLSEQDYRKADLMRKNLLGVLVNIGVERVETATHTVTTPRVGGKQALTIGKDLPGDESFMEEYGFYTPPPEKGTWSIDKDKIRKDLKKGIKIDRVRLEPRGRRLSIK